MDFMEALAELYPTCEAFCFQNCGKLFLAEDVRKHKIPKEDRFIRFGVNVRFFNIQGTGDMLVDTVGMSTLFLPDLQYHFHDMDPTSKRTGFPLQKREAGFVCRQIKTDKRPRCLLRHRGLLSVPKANKIMRF